MSVHTKEENDKFFDAQEKLISDFVDQIKENVINHHREKCTNTGKNQEACETVLARTYLPLIINNVIHTKMRKGEL